MGSLGISVFLGMGQSSVENAEYMAMANHYGYRRLFTSLHIPEADNGIFLSEGRALLAKAKQLGFAVTADISPNSWDLLGLKPENLQELGIDTLRADWGFAPEQLLELTEQSGLQIEINASTITEEALEKMLAYGFSSRSLRAGHNYYPRPETGLSYALFSERSRCLSRRGISIAAFIPGKSCKRGPIFAGLPTIEAHRQMPTLDAVRQLWTSGRVDTILFGDPLASEEELAAVAALPRETPKVIELQAKVAASAEFGAGALWALRHTNRLDASVYSVRSQESRGISRSAIVPQAVALPRRRGDITVDNSLFGRYAGEMQIVLQDLPADARVNVVGRIISEDFCLLECLEPGRCFCLKEAL